MPASGSMLIDGTATTEFGGAFNVSIILDADATATLTLNYSVNFSGVVSGFDGNDIFDLADIAAGSGTLSYASNAQDIDSILTGTNGTHTANVKLVGQYSAVDFQATADSGMGTLIDGKLLLLVEDRAHNAQNL